jgi:phosphopantetheine--protein transferase-like protein
MAESIDREAIRTAVAAFLGVEVARLAPDFPLGDRLRNSIARAGLQARLQRAIGGMPPPLVDVPTYGQLERLLLGDAAGGRPADGKVAHAAAGPDRGDRRPVASDGGAGLRCGIDIEPVESLPEAGDFWSHPFYMDNFSPAEIAECVRDAAPRERFAARWCAKEALLKCDPSYRAVPLAGIELRKDGGGAPRLHDVATGAALPVAVSISHAGGFAAAVVVAAAPPPAPPPVSPATAPAPAIATPAVATGPLPMVALAAALLALAISLVTVAGVWIL